jgi:hypothetical protein
MEEGAIIQLNPAMRIVASLASALLCTATAASAQTAGDLKLQPAAIVARAAALVDGAELAYVSDYLSFAGEDGAGRVAFALDTNRGVAGDEHQAEHFAVLYDSREGWIDLDGSTDFPNEQGALLDYPDSPYFVFSGEPYAIDQVRSVPNDLRLSLDALEPRVTIADDATVFSMASAAAELEWHGRRIPGRVIYEYLAMRDSNRIAGASFRSVLGMLTDPPNFQGLYLASASGDFYLHLAHNSAAAFAENPLMAFWTVADLPRPIRNLEFGPMAHELAAGFYRWPSAWGARFESECGIADLSVHSVSQQTQTNWVIGGFAMQYIEGSLRCGDETETLFGFAELIR